MRFPILMLLPVLLASCSGGREDGRPGAVRPRAGGPVTVAGQTPRDTAQCHADLVQAGVQYRALADRDHGSGCMVLGAVQLLDIGTPVANLTAMRCPLARSFAAWVRHGVRPAARQMLGSDIARVESYGTFACRGIRGGGSAAAGRVSEHGLANAVDIAAFVLEDGRRITVEQDWNRGDASSRAFLRTVHRSACRRFGTVLGPDYNAAHYNHFHFDMGRGPFCR